MTTTQAPRTARLNENETRRLCDLIRNAPGLVIEAHADSLRIFFDYSSTGTSTGIFVNLPLEREQIQ